MEDAVESLIVEEESKKLVKSKSIFHRFRNRSTSENNNGTDSKDSAIVSGKMTPNKESGDSSASNTSPNEEPKDIPASSIIPNEQPNDLPISSASPNEVTNNSPTGSTSSSEDGIYNEPKYNGVKEMILNGIREKRSSASQKSSSCLLLRLFESKLFDMSIAMSYLFKSKESGVQAYLGNKLFVSIQGL